MKTEEELDRKDQERDRAILHEMQERARKNYLTGMDRKKSGTWVIWGEECVDKVLAVVSGKYEDVFEYALGLEGFFEWGVGGKIVETEVKKVPNLAERRRLAEAKRLQLTLPEGEANPIYPSLKRVPERGEVIYVPGGNGLRGGQAEIDSVEEGISEGKPTIYVRVGEQPSMTYNWSYLEPNQERWKKRYDDEWASEGI